MSSRGRFLMLTVAAVLGMAGQAFFGCASGETEDVQDDDDAVGGAAGQGGQGGAVGGGGNGGGEWPCGTDCSQIATDQCQQGICDVNSQSCQIVDRDDGTPCDDGLFCSVDDECVGGVCTGGPPNDCGLTAAACETINCSEQAQSCSPSPAPDGTSCAAADPCTVNASCTNGLCLGSTKDCTFAPVPDACHVAECNSNTGDCEPVPGNDGATCIDPNDKCQVNGTCSSGNCTNTQPKDCSYMTQGCQLGVCDSNTGDCGQTPAPNGGSCDDFNGCTSAETCDAGQCVAGQVTTTCIDNDDCCPPTCTESNDTDCILDILLMGEDVSASGWNVYRSALTAAGVTWDERNLDAVAFPTVAQLDQYNVLLWFNQAQSSVTDAQAGQVATWLGSGDKNLFITSHDLMYDFGTATVGTGEHNLYTLWGATYVGDYAGTSVATIDGVLGDPISDDFASPNGLLLSQDSYSDGDYADEAQGPASFSGLYGPGGSGSGHAALTRYHAGPYKVVWLGVNFHNGLTDAAQQAQLLKNVLDYFRN